MLRQVRHISEGNFYGLRVTNKARKLTLAKEIRTLEACRDVQTHVYRKEEKELLGTLKRLQLTKHDHFDHHEDYEHPERLASHHDRTPSFHAKQHSSDDQRPLRRPAERQDRKLHLKIKSEIGGDHRSSTKVPCQVNVSTNASDVSVIISLSPIADSNPGAKQMSPSTLPPVSKKEAGTHLHRTEAFMSCVVCNLPAYAHGRESKCTCQHNPSKRAHHIHELKNGSKKRRKSNADEEDLKKFGAKREGMLDNVPARHTLRQGLPKFAVHQIHHRRSRASSFEDDNKNRHAPRGLDEYTAYVPGIGPHKRNFTDNNGAPAGHEHDHRKCSRENTLGQSKSRKSCLEEGPSRWGSYIEGRNDESRFGDHGEPHYMRPLKGHGSRHNKTRQEEELYDLYNRLKRIFSVHDRRQYHGNERDHYHRYTHHPGDHPHSTHLPLSKSHRDATYDEKTEYQAPAFSGLLHPDNIINHHHFLPHEANKRDKPRSTTLLHAPVHSAGSHVSGVDHHEHRQEVC